LVLKALTSDRSASGQVPAAQTHRRRGQKRDGDGGQDQQRDVADAAAAGRE
jgi:hypothetical protein